MKKREKGALGENIAAEYLRSKGFTIIERNFSCRLGEADIIAEGGGCLVFAEVKLRKDRRFAEAREFVDRKKQERIIKTAKYYLMKHETDLPVRFDVIEIYGTPGSGAEPQIEHIENAFE